MLNAILSEPMFCGAGPLIHQILYKGWSTSQQNRVSYEDYFQDFVVIWLKYKHKFDPARGKMTTFAGTVALNFVRAQIKKSDRRSRVRYFSVQSCPFDEDFQFDVAVAPTEFDADELAVIEAYDRLESHKKIGLTRRLCQATEISKDKLLDTMEGIRDKVRNRDKRAVVAVITA
jgi:hypothetical protein